MSMLHLSIHNFGWHKLVEDQENPEKEAFYDLQIDPTMLLLQLKMKADFMLLKNEFEESLSDLDNKLGDRIHRLED